MKNFENMNKNIEPRFWRWNNRIPASFSLWICNEVKKSGDEGSRTPVQNGLKQASTSVDIYSLGLFREYHDLLNNPKCFWWKH